jgi:hypothetical protein
MTRTLASKINKEKMCSIGYWCSWTAFILLCLININNSRSSIALSEVGYQSISSENLRSLADRLVLSIAVENPSLDIDSTKESEYVKQIQEKLDGYATRLSLHQEQHRRFSLTISMLSMIAAFSMCGFVIANRKIRRANQSRNGQ